METQLVGQRKYAPARLGRVLVLGLGKSGRCAVEYLQPLVGTRVESLSIAGGNYNAAAADFAESQRALAHARGCDIDVAFDVERFEGSYDLCIASPGISQFSDFYLNAAAVCGEVISEVEFAWRESLRESRWVAVTGTNGKTTVTALAAHILRACGMRARAVGNIGDVALEAVAGADAPDVYVVEASSFQLAGTSRFAPDVAILLNITPDHLSWHCTHEHYTASKMKVLQNLAQSAVRTAVLDATDATVRAKVRELKALDACERGFAYVPLGTAEGIGGNMALRCGSENAAYLDDGMLTVLYEGRRHVLCAADELQVKGAHNALNALAAASAAVALGGADECIAQGLRSFAALPHRIEPCGSIGGISCYNDSKATNVDAVVKALGSFAAGTVVLLAGGRDKGTSLEGLVQAAKQQAKAVVCFGEARTRLHAAFAEGAPGLRLADAQHMEDAFEAALAQARPGDVLLLSPACASFDEFSCYQERGDEFKRLVAAHAAAADAVGDGAIGGTAAGTAAGAAAAAADGAAR